MSWEQWSRADQAGLARYVSRHAARFLRLPGQSSSEVGDRRPMVAAIYQELTRAGIRYAREEYHPSAATQIIRTPAELLAGQGRGTCLDLATLFCGMCLGHGLLPVLIVLDGHAFAAVSTTHGLRDWDAYDRRERDLFAHAPLTDANALRELVDRGTLIPVECTGFSAATGLPATTPEGAGREDGLLSFDQAVLAGRQQLDVVDRPLAFALDIATAWCGWGIEPIRLGGHLSVHIGSGLVIDVGADDDRPRRTSDPDPTIRAYTRPIRPALRQPRDLVGRDEETAAVQDAVAQGEHVVLAGEAGSGRTSMLSRLAHQDWGDRFRDGVIYLPARGQTPDDFRQSLFEALYHPDVPYRPDPAGLANLLGDLHALILVDDADDLLPAERDWLSKTVPDSAAVLTARQAARSDCAVVEIGGLPPDIAAELLPHDEHDTDAARQIGRTLNGHPADLVLAADLLRHGSFTITDLAAWLDGGRSPRPALIAALVKTLSQAENDVLSLLASLGEPISAQHVYNLVGQTDGEEGLRALRRRGLVISDPPKVWLDTSFAEGIRSAVATGPWLERALDHLCDWAEEHAEDPDRLLAEAPAVLRVIKAAQDLGRWTAVARLSRIMRPALTLGCRWGARGIVLGLAFEAGRQLGDAALSQWPGQHIEAGPPGHIPPPTDATPSADATSPLAKAATGLGALAVAGVVAGALVVTGPSIWAAITDEARPSTAINKPQPSRDPGTRTEPPQVTGSTDPPPTSRQNPSSSVVTPPPITSDPFPAGVRNIGGVVRANGFSYYVISAEARETTSRPEVVVEMEITNEVWQEPTAPFSNDFSAPLLRVRGGNALEGPTNISPLAIGESARARLTFYGSLVDDSFQWNDAVLVFPVFGRVHASVPLGDTGQWVTLPPGALSISGSLTSGQARLDFYPKGLYRSDVALSDGVHDEGFDSGGLQPGKGSLLIRFNLTLAPDTTNVSIGNDSFSLTLPDGRVIRPDHAPILVSPNQSSYQGLIIATQVDTPAAGTYKLTFTCGVLNGYGQPGQPVTIPFTVAAPS